MTSHLFRCRGAAAIVVVACCSLVLGNAFGQDEDGHVFGDSNLDGFFSNVDGQQDNGIDAPECSLNDSGDVTFGGELGFVVLIMLLHICSVSLCHICCCVAGRLQTKRW